MSQQRASVAPRTPSKPVVTLPAPPLPGTPPPHKQRGYFGDDNENSNAMMLMDIVNGGGNSEHPPGHGPEFASPNAAASANSLRDGKIVLDRVYEHVALPRIAIDIIDTPEFQRLRGLKQLGFTSWLYPGATHTRFEHSIGVAHLANMMIKKIARQQPELGITEADVLVVTVAGLCHDIGHGPFSHLFEVIVNKAREEKGLPEFHHEAMSVALLRRVLARLDLASYGLDHHDAYLMQLCIKGLKPGAPWPEKETGRVPWKRFLVEVVSNKRNGVDVDKLDYFMRDSLCCYGRATVDCHIPRLISACRVLYFNGEYQLCFEEKLAQPLGDIFTLRAKMHKYAYQHRIIRVIDHMVTDILGLADPHLKVKGGGSGTAMKSLSISECVEDEEGYIRLGDWIMSAIDASPLPEMGPAQELIARLNNREFYSVAGHGTMGEYLDPVSKKEVKHALIAILTRKIKENGGVVDDRILKGANAATANTNRAASANPLLRTPIAIGGGPHAHPYATPSDSTPAELMSPQNATTAVAPMSMLSLSAKDAAATTMPTAGASSPNAAATGGAMLTTSTAATAVGQLPYRSPNLAAHRPLPLVRENTDAPPVEEDPHGMSPEAHAFLAAAEEALIVDFVKIHYGSSDSEGNPDDPINHVTFFNPKRSLTQGFNLPKDRQSPLFSPMKFGEKSIVLIVRNRKFVPCFAQAFEEWKAVNRHRFISTVPVYNFSPSKNAAAKRPREVDNSSQLSDGWTH